MNPRHGPIVQVSSARYREATAALLVTRPIPKRQRRRPARINFSTAERCVVDFDARTDPLQCGPFRLADSSNALLRIAQNAMPTALLTGFPGFLASAFLPDFLSRTDAQTRVTCLVQSHFRPMAEERAKKIAATHPEWNGRIQIVEGDITHPELDLKAGANE